MTYLEKAKEMLKDAPYPPSDKDIIVELCPKDIGLEELCECHFINCEFCWNREYKEPKKRKTRKEVFLERFPNAFVVEINKERKKPGFCARKIFGESIRCYDNAKCTDCWNEPAPAEYQEDEE